MNKYLTVYDALKAIMGAAEVPLDELEADLLQTENGQSESVKKANEPRLWQPHVFIELFQRAAKQSMAGTQLAAAIHNSTGTSLALRWYEMTSTGYPKLDGGTAERTMALITDMSQSYHRAHQDYQSGELNRNNLKFRWTGEALLKFVCFERIAFMALLDDEGIKYLNAAGSDSNAVSNQQDAGVTSEGANLVRLTALDERSLYRPVAVSRNDKCEASALVKHVSDDIPDHSGITFDEFWEREFESIAKRRERWSTADLNQLLWIHITKIASTKDAASRPTFFPVAFSSGEKLYYSGSLKPYLTLSASGKRVRARLITSNRLITE